MSSKKLIYSSDARKAILKADPKLAYCIDGVPGVDAVAVVRCRDCKYKHPDLLCCCNIRIYDEPISVRIKLDDFCSYGERREGE